jgi:hypothetical protein
MGLERSFLPDGVELRRDGDEPTDFSFSSLATLHLDVPSGYGNEVSACRRVLAATSSPRVAPSGCLLPRHAPGDLSSVAPSLYAACAKWT